MHSLLTTTEAYSVSLQQIRLKSTTQVTHITTIEIRSTTLLSTSKADEQTPKPTQL